MLQMKLDLEGQRKISLGLWYDKSGLVMVSELLSFAFAPPCLTLFAITNCSKNSRKVTGCVVSL